MKKKLEAPQLKYMHLRSEQGKGSVTIGYKVNFNRKEVEWTKARCAPHDNFCRRIGRMVCQGRFLTNGAKRSNGTIRAFVKSFTFTKDGHKAYAEIKARLVKEHPDYFEVVGEEPRPYTSLKVVGGINMIDPWEGM